MPGPRFVTTLTFGAPGVYVQRVAPTPQITANAVNLIGIVSTTIRGPVNIAVRCDNYARFAAVFGERDFGSGGPIANPAWLYQYGKPFSSLVVVRAAAAAAAAASYTARTAAGGGGSNVLQITASSVGSWAQGTLFWRVLAASDGNTNHFNLEIKYLTQDIVYQNVDISAAGVDTTAQIVGNDPATLITLTKLANGRPINSAASTDGADANGFIALGATNAGYTSVVGSDGSIADSDYTGTGGPMEVLNSYAGLVTMDVAGHSSSSVKAKIFTLSASTNAGQWLIRPDTNTTSLSTFITEVATYRNTDGRIIPCFDSQLIVDFSTDLQVNTDPTSWMAYDLAQTDPDSHPGRAANAQRHAAIVGLQFPALQDSDYDNADAAGINVMELRYDPNGNAYYGWVSGLTSSLDPETRQITDVRISDFIVAGAIQRLSFDTYEPNTKSRRRATNGAIFGWLSAWAKKERFIAMDDNNVPQCSVQNDLDVNTPQGWAANQQITLIRGQTIANILFNVLLTQIGPQVTVQVTTQAAGTQPNG